jgi:sugar phosphate isomerase/epimerase
MSFAFQLYSSRNTASQAAFLSTLSSLGYTSVEGYGGVYENPSSFAAALQGAGLTMPSGHFALDSLRSGFAGTMELADALGVFHIIVPFLTPEERPKDREGWQALGLELEGLAARVQQHGKTLSWHNHEFEFEPLPDGSLPMSVLLEAAPSIGWEADLAWIARAELDPAVYVTRYADRLTAVHVKDIAPEGENPAEDGWADIGDGVLPWGGLIGLIRTVAPEAFLVAEHDNPSDPERFARVSISSLKGI